MSDAPVFKISSWPIYVIGFMGLSAVLSGIYGLSMTPWQTWNTYKSDELNCLEVKTNSPSCANAETYVKRNWERDTNQLTGYSLSILIHGIILCSISIYMYKCKEPSSV